MRQLKYRSHWPYILFFLETHNPSGQEIICLGLGQTWAIKGWSGYASRSSSSINTGTRRIILLDKLSYVVRLERCTTEHSSSRRTRTWAVKVSSSGYRGVS